MTTPTYERLGATLQRLRDDFIEGAGSFKYDHENGSHVVGLSLYGTILELFGSIGILVSATDFTPVPILMRTMIEAVIDLGCLRRDAHHVQVMGATHHREKLKFLERVRDDPVTDEVAEDARRNNIQGMIDLTRAELEKLGIRKNATTVFAKAQKAEMLPYYRTVYASLCQDTHNDLLALEKRHITKEGGEPRIVFFEMREDRDLLIWTLTAVEMVGQATDDIRSILKSQDTPGTARRIENCQEIIRDLHAQLEGS